MKEPWNQRQSFSNFKGNDLIEPIKIK
jgi:hypothetical protein